MANPAAAFYNMQGTPANAEVPGARFEGDVEIVLTGVTYLTNGLTVASLLTGLPLLTVTHFEPTAIGPSLDATVNGFSYDRANQKVKLYNAGTEIANAAALDAYKLYAHVGGRR